MITMAVLMRKGRTREVSSLQPPGRRDDRRQQRCGNYANPRVTVERHKTLKQPPEGL